MPLAAAVMLVAKSVLSNPTRAVADLRPRDQQSLDYQAEIGSILGGIFGGLAVLVAVIIGGWQIWRWMKEDKKQEEADQRRYNRWYRKLGRMLWPFRSA